jgi:hypothetical protein
MKLDNLILDSHGRIVTVRFIKKDGTVRQMVCRLGVTKHLKGGQSTLNPEQYITAFDMQKQDYRAINRATILSVTAEHVSWLSLGE